MTPLSFAAKICLVLLLSLLLLSGASAAADPWTGAVSPSLSQTNGIYQITNSSDLARLAKDVNGGNTYLGKTLQLTADLDLNNLPWTPIGGSDKQFLGTFAGLHHNITNLSVNQPKNSYLGLFGSLGGATVTDLSVTGTVVGRDNIGGLAGSVVGGSITNCTSGVYLTGASATTGQSNQGIGGLVGHIQSGTVITNCSATGNVRGFGGQYIGGLVGWIEKGIITGSCATGSVVGTLQSNDGNDIGGLVGRMEEGCISKSYATGPVTGVSFVGGLVGTTKAPLSECYATGSVTAATDYAGGLVGRQSGGLVDNCYATGTVIGRDEVGGLIGYAAGDLKHSYAIGNVIGRTDVGGLVGQENIRPDQCAALNQYVNGTGSSINRAVGQKGGPANGLVYAWNGMQAGGSPFTNPTTIDNQGKDTSISQFWNNFSTGSGSVPWGNWSTGIWTINNPIFPGYRLPVFSWQTTAPVVDLTVFRPIYSITAVSGPGGSVNPSGTLTVRQGFDQTYTIAANAGYTILNVTIDGVPISGTSYTFSSINASHVLIATFSPVLYTVTASSGAGGTITPSGPVSVLQGSSVTFTVTPDIGYNVSSVTSSGATFSQQGNNYTFSDLMQNSSITATFVPKTYTITASSDTNGTISPTGGVSVIHGANQTFIIIANTSNEIENIRIGETNLTHLTNETTGLTIAENKSWAVYQFPSLTQNSSIHAYFKYNSSMGTLYDSPQTYNITASSGANGTITPEGQVTIQEKLNQTFRIDADSGYEIADVTVNGTVISTSDSNYTITSDNITAFYTFSRVTADAAISTNFTKKPVLAYELTITSGAGGSLNPAGVVTVPPGTRQNISITANPGYYIDQIFVNGAVVDASDANLTISVGNTTAFYLLPPAAGDTSVSATFLRSLVYYTVTTGKNGEFGYISPFGTLRVLESTSLNFTIQANSGYNITTITVDDVAVSPTWITENSSAWYNFSGISADHTLYVTFSAAASPPPVTTPHRITASADTGGSIAPAGIFNVSTGDSAVFTITPYAGYAIANVTVNGTSVGNAATYTLENILADTSVQATFSWVGFPSYAITATTTAGGTITPLGTITVATGYSQQFNMQADTGYTIGQVFIDGTPVPGYTGNTTASYTFPTVLSDHQIDVTYTLSSPPVTHQITVSSADANGTISPSGTLQVLNGSTNTFTIRANSGYLIGTLQNNETNITTASGQTEYQYTLVISSPITISVNFTALPPVTHTLTVTSGSNGSITPSGTISAVNGTTQSFLISADTRHVIENISVGGTNITDAANLTSYVYGHSVNGPVTISAFFVQNASSPGSTHAPRNITVISGPGGTIDPSGNLTINATDTKPFNITANPGYVIDHVSVTGQPDDYSFSGLNTATYTLSNLGSDVSFTAFFRQDTLTLNVPPVSHGSISPSGTITTYPGAQLNFTITPDAGYEIDQFSYGGQSISPVNGNYTITAQSGSSLLVSFKQATTPIPPAEIHNITISSGPHGLISPSGTFQITNGSSLNLTVQASPGFFISSVTANGVEIAAGPGSTQTFGTYNLIAVTKDTIIIASFTQQPAPPSPESGGGGDHGTTVYPITSTGTATTGAGTGITTVLLPAGIFGAVTITDLPSTIPAPPSGSYLTSVISVPSYTAGHAEIEFSVPVSILTDLGLTVHDVTFLTYDGTSWISHTTYYLGQTLGAANYVTAVTGFGPSAIGYKVGGAQIIIRATPEPLDTSRPAGTCTPRMTTTPSFVPTGSVYHTVAPDSTSTLQTAPAPFLGALAGLCAVVFLLRKRR